MNYTQTKDLCVYKHTQIGHSKGGRWEEFSPDKLDIIFLVTPILNLSYYILWFTDHPRNKSINLNKFFKIKK